MVNEALLKSNNQEWETPHAFFEAMHKSYDFTLDACATKQNAKVPHFFSPENDGLSKSWAGHRVWLNPPYAPKRKTRPGQIDWVQKAYDETKEGDCELVVCLLPARTDTKLFHDYVMKSSLVAFVKGRLQFVGAPHGAVFPSMVVVFERHSYKLYPFGPKPMFVTFTNGGKLI